MINRASKGFPTTFYRPKRLQTIGFTYGSSLNYAPQIMSIGMYNLDHVKCPPNSLTCYQFYSIETPPFQSQLSPLSRTQNQSLTSSKIYKMFQTTIYHVYASVINGTKVSLSPNNLSECHPYGYDGHGKVLCAKDVRTEQNETSVLIDNSHS